jgi:hypothetical protein
LLRWLANIALLFVLSAGTLFVGIPVFWLIDRDWLGFVVPIILAPAGGMLAAVSWRQARRELDEMADGLVDPSGEWEIKFARDRGRVTFILSLVLPILYFLCWCMR